MRFGRCDDFAGFQESADFAAGPIEQTGRPLDVAVNGTGWIGVQAADGSITSHGAIYLWNQPATEANHTPAWDTFKVPPVGPVQ